jgi:hypothetical protein
MQPHVAQAIPSQFQLRCRGKLTAGKIAQEIFRGRQAKGAAGKDEP